MEKVKQADSEEISLANYFAVDILETIFKNDRPSEEEIERLEHELESQYTNQLEKLSTRSTYHALILSSHLVEQKTLFFALRYLGYWVSFASNQNDLLQYQHEKFHLVIISDHFKELGFNMLTAYFHAEPKEYQPFLIYLGNDAATEYIKLGFDAHLKSPFLIKSLINLLSDNSAN